MPDGSIQIDATGRAAGRGAYVCRQDECLQRAARTGALGRALSTRIPPEVLDALTATTSQQPTTLTTPTNEGGARGQE